MPSSTSPNKYSKLRGQTLAAALSLMTAFGPVVAQAAQSPDCPATAPVVHRAKPKPKPKPRPVEAVPVVAPTPVAPAVVALPPPPPAPAPIAPAVPPQPQLQPIVYDATKPIGLPGATVVGGDLSQKDQDFVDASDCNYKGFWNAVKHPVNAQCKENSVTQTSTAVGSLGELDGKAVFVLSGPVALTVSRESRGTHGQGWLIPAATVVGVAGGIVIGQEGINVARQSLASTQNLNNSITNGITTGKFTSLFGSLNCGNAGVSGSSVGGSVNASCNVANTAVNSVLGNGGVVNATNTVAKIASKFGLGN